MRRICTLLIAFAMIPALAFAQAEPPKKEPAKEPEKPKLNPGDKAPPIKVTKWLQGEAVPGFDKDKVYVIEFWATWCGPCIRAMPHLSELQSEYKDQGLVIIGLTTKGDGNDADKVAKFVEKNGKKFAYRFAYCEDKETDTAYMDAAKQDGIPCSFVIGKDGNIAYIGHPSNLDDVLPLVMAGTWKGKPDLDAINKVNEELDAILSEGDKEPAKTLEKLAVFEKAHPKKAKQDLVMIQKMIMMVKAEKFDEAKAQAEAMIAATDAKKKAEPGIYAGLILAQKNFNPNKKLLDVAVKATDAALKYDAGDVGMLIASMDVYLLAGEKAKAAELGKKALAAAENEMEKKQIQMIVDEKLKGEEKK
jgi:thiol-disulfide isomerase/thioredoxin